MTAHLIGLLAVFTGIACIAIATMMSRDYDSGAFLLPLTLAISGVVLVLAGFFVAIFT